MSLHILACLCSGASSSTYWATRLVLPSGVLTDELAQDLRMRFASPVSAAKLCSSPTPLRGLPSGGRALTQAEQTLAPAVPPTAVSYQDLMDISDEVHATSVHVFDGSEWLRLLDHETQETLRGALLYKLVDRS